MKATASILITTTAALLLSVLAMGQGVGINTAGTNPHTSAVLDVASTTQGVLTPRMTEAERIAITNPATGLLVYQTDGRPGFRFWDGTEWLFLRGMTSVPGRVEVASGCISTVASPVAYPGFNVNYNCDLGVGQVTWPAGYFDNNPIVNLSSSEVQVPPPAPDIYCIPTFSAPCTTPFNADQIIGVRVYESTTGVGGPYVQVMEYMSDCEGSDNGNYNAVNPAFTVDFKGNVGGVCVNNWYRISVQSSTEWNDAVQGFIDWNADGDFLDVGIMENIPNQPFGMSQGGWVNSQNFQVPAAAMNGNTVMRIRSYWVGSTSQPGNPCLGGTWGETEDFSVSISCATDGPAPEIACICTVTGVTTTSFNYKCTLLSGAPADPYLVNFDLVPNEN